MLVMSKRPSRLVLPVPDLNFTRLWEVGSVRFHPAGTASTLVTAARDSAPVAGPAWYEEVVDESAAEFNRCAVAEVTAVDIDEATALVMDALAVLRVVQRLRNPMVDVRQQTFGLPGQVTAGRSDYLDITDAPTIGWWHVGAVAGWTFRDADHDAWTSEPAFRFLNEGLAQPEDDRTSLQRRALIAVDLFNQAWLSWRPDVALLNFAMELEVLLGEEGDRAKKYRVARRVSYFVCGLPNDRHADGRPACPYLTYAIKKDGNPSEAFQGFLEEVRDGLLGQDQARAELALGKYCSQFFDVLDLHDARNVLAHGGRLDLTAREEGQATWYLTGWLLRPVLTWFAEHPDSELTELDAEIATLPKSDAHGSD